LKVEETFAFMCFCKNERLESTRVRLL